MNHTLFMKINYLALALVCAASCGSPADKEQSSATETASVQKHAAASDDRPEETAAPQQDKKSTSEPLPPQERTIKFTPPVIVDRELPDPPVIDDSWDDGNTKTAEIDDWGFKPPKESKEVRLLENPKEPVIHAYVDEPAEFPGGVAAMRKFIDDNLVYPHVAKEMGIEGKCQLQFIVSAKGNISNVKVMRGVADCPECDREAVRLVKSMPQWKPGKLKQEPVNSTFNLPIAFKLD
jgi:periplasmic protein TonB